MSRLAQLRRSVRSRLGIPVTDQFQTDDVIDEHINIAIQTIEQEQRWPWQETVQTVTINDSSGEFTVPADWRATRTIIFDRHQVQVVSPTELLTHPATGTGTPQIATVIDRVVKMRPSPAVGNTLSHVYYRTPTLLVDDEDQPQMPTEFSPAIIAKAAELLSIREDDRAAGAAHAAEYGEWITRMKRDVRRTTGPIVPRVRPGRWV
jgi:hypothetical protein